MRPALPSASLHRVRARTVLVALIALLTGLVTAAAPAHAEVGLTGGAQTGMTRIGPAPRIPSGATAAGPVTPTSAVHVTVALAPRDPAGLAAYARAVATPGSPDYHRYLTVGQFAARFGASADQVAAVRATLRADGLSPSGASANGLLLSLTTSAQTASTAFATRLERYRVSGGRSAIASTSAPAVPSTVASLIQGVVGLDSISLPAPSGVIHRRPLHPGLTGRGARVIGGATGNAVTVPGATGACSGAAHSGAYTAGQIASAYGFSGLYGTGDGGAGTTIALFELEPFSAGDIQTYQSCYGTHAQVNVTAVDGGAGAGSGSGEAALDIEDIIGLAPQATVDVYEGPNTGSGAYDTYAQIVNDDRAKVISTSWGLCETLSDPAQLQAENTLFEEAAAQGQTVVAAAGDSGVDDCGNRGGPAVDDPASQPYVTGVGGTTMHPGTGAPVESVWNSTWSGGAGAGAGAGGASAQWTMPQYQSGTALAQTQTTCGGAGTSCREVPDVTADADVNTGYAIYYSDPTYGSAWYQFGGTSAAAPTWAALIALSNSWSGCSAPLGFLNPSLYATARTAYASTFNDVTSGNNAFDGIAGFSAATGYDMASGLGSPQGSTLAAALCGAANPPVSPAGTPTTAAPVAGSTSSTTTSPPPATTTTPAPPAGAPVTPAPVPVVRVALPAAVRAATGGSVRISPVGSDSAGDRLNWQASGLPDGLAIQPATGMITGSVSRAVQATVTVAATDAAGSRGEATMRLTVRGRPRVTATVTYPSRGRVLLALQASAGQFAGGIQRLALRVRTQVVLLGRGARALRSQIRLRGAGAHRLAVRILRRGNLLVLLLRRAAPRLSLRLLAPVASRGQSAVAAAAPGRRHAPLFTVTVG